jgi:perosamine synthetase
MLRLVPPAGTPLKVTQALVSMGTANGRSDKALAALATQLHVKHTFSVSSGRAGLWVILKALHRLRPERNVVALPAYICFSVPASIVRAGMKIEPVDVDPQTLDFDFSQLEELPADRLLCVIASNLFGLPNDITRIQQLAQAKSAFVVDNAAQGLGAVFKGRFLGTTGDVGLYSLGRGKALTTLEGGIVVTNSDEIAAALGTVAAELPEPSISHDANLLLQMLAYAVLLRPRLYWIPNSLPCLKLGVTDFDPSFPVSTLSPLRKALLWQVLDGLDAVNQTRCKNAQFLVSALAGCSRFQIPRPTPNSQGTYTRFPILAADQSTRQSALRRLRAAGIGASPFYPSAICDIPGIGNFTARREFHCRRAEDISGRLFTVPTHPYVQMRDLDTVAKVLGRF